MANLGDSIPQTPFTPHEISCGGGMRNGQSKCVAADGRAHKDAKDSALPIAADTEDEEIIVVKCIAPFRDQILKGNRYLALEMMIHLSRGKAFYRVIDEQGCPAIYDADLFEIESDSLNGFCIQNSQDSIVLSHKAILDPAFKEKDVDGFWGLYFNRDSAAFNLLKEVVDDFVSKETDITGVNTDISFG